MTALLKSEPKYLSLNWEKIDDLVDQVANYCAEQCSEIVGLIIVSRGGLVPGGILAQTLNIKNLRVICVESYQGRTKTDLKIAHKPDDVANGGQNWVVIDDLVDSGETISYIRRLYPYATYVSLLAKPSGKPQIDFSAQDVDQDRWVVFPWE
jgi:xanthine phosphoribosyltransferase